MTKFYAGYYWDWRNEPPGDPAADALKRILDEAAEYMRKTSYPLPYGGPRYMTLDEVLIAAEKNKP